MKHRKKWAGKIILIVVIIAAVVFLAFSCKKKMDEARQMFSSSEASDVVTKRSLIKSVGATGSIISVDTENVTVELTGVKVKDVNVEIGDIVNAGDLLLTFDSEDIEESLSRAEETLENAITKNELSASDSDRNLSDAERNKEFQLYSANVSVENAKKNYDNAVDTYNDAVDKLEELKEKEEEARESFEEKEAGLESISSVLNMCEEEYNYQKENGSPTSSAYIEAQQKYTMAQTTYSAISAEKTAAETKYNSAEASRKAQETTVKTAKLQMESMLTSYETAKKSYDNTVAGQNSSITSVKNSQTITNMNLSTYNEQKQVDLYKEQLEKCTVYAPISGVVTAVNVKAGDTYAGTVLVTIKDCSAFEVEAEIDEYDISDIKLGQQVLIKTKATGEKEIAGTVNFISPTASSSGSMVSSGSEVKYKVRISVDEPNDRLRLDMSASISIIIEEHDDVLTVPYSAVWTDESGNTFVTELLDADEYKDIPVTVIMESNYYTEISGDGIYEGMKVKLIESETDELWMFRGGF